MKDLIIIYNYTHMWLMAAHQLSMYGKFNIMYTKCTMCACQLATLVRAAKLLMPRVCKMRVHKPYKV